MLPLLPVNTVADGLKNIEQQAKQMNIGQIICPLLNYVKDQWMEKVTPDLFCVHRLENRINENVIAPFKKLRDFLLLVKGKTKALKQPVNVLFVVENLIELENFLSGIYSTSNKKAFTRDLSSLQKRNVIRAWSFIENHPKININQFFNKVLGYIKSMENQLWIWGFYRYSGPADDDLINAANFSIIGSDEQTEVNDDGDYVSSEGNVMDVLEEHDGVFVNEVECLQERSAHFDNSSFQDCETSDL